MKFSNLLPELSFPQSSLSEVFESHHQRYLETFPGWSIQSTRRKLAAFYWLKIVLKHFLVLTSVSAFLALFITHQQNLLFFQALIPASMLVFLILFISMYWPMYQLEFLPHLDTCAENYAGRQIEGIQACKKQQYSVVSLVLIQCVTMELAGMKNPLLNTATAQLFARQYGVSVKSVGPALQLILRGDWNRKSIRKQTEIIDDFETAKSYFLELSDDRAIQLLEKLQQKVLR